MKKCTVLVLLLTALVLLAACAAPTTPAPATPTTGQRLCTTSVLDGEKMDAIMSQLGYVMGKDALPPILVNGRQYDSPKNVDLNKGDVVSLANGLGCMPGYNKATEQYFDVGLVTNYKGSSKSISGFQRSITAENVDELGASQCENLLKGYYDRSLTDLKKECDFKTVAKYSTVDGTVSCNGYDNTADAVNAVKSISLADVKSLAIAVLTAPGENWSEDLCR